MEYKMLLIFFNFSASSYFPFCDLWQSPSLLPPLHTHTQHSTLSHTHTHTRVYPYVGVHAWAWP